MAFSIPTFKSLLERVRSDFGGFTDGTTPPESVEFVLASIQARLTRGLYGFLTYILRQAFPDTAESPYFWRWFSIFGLTPKQAVPWEGTVLLSGTNGVTIPDATQLQRADGALYETDGAVVISGGTASPALRAVTADAASNLAAADPISLATPLIGVDPEGVVASVTQTGTDDEVISDALVRLLLELRTPPRGGGPGDYARWALEVPGVTRAWEYPTIAGPNTVSVAFVRDNDGSGADIVPDAGERAAVLAYLETVAPVTVEPVVIPVTASLVTVTLSELTPNTAAVLAAVNESLADLFEREAQPGATLYVSQIREAISAAAGEEDHVLASPASDLVFSVDEMPIFVEAVIV